MATNEKVRKLILFSLFFFWAGSLTQDLAAEITKVWAVNDGEKVYRYQQDHPARQGNSVWDGSSIRLRGLYNEVVAFQLIVETDSSGAEAIDVSVTPPRNSNLGYSIGAEQTPEYGPRGFIEIFSEHYIEVQRPTPSAWFFGSEKSAPPRPVGWIPDPLIPPDALPGKGGFPISIPASKERLERDGHEVRKAPPYPVQNQAFWVDLYLPRDRELPAGNYVGSVRVLENGREVANLPLEVELINAYLPDQNHSKVWLYTSDVSSYFPDLPEEELFRKIKFISHRHRIEVVGGFQPHRSRFDSDMMMKYLPYLDGKAFTPKNGFHGPGENEGETIFPVGMYGTPVLGETKEEIQKESDKWVTWFEENAPEVTFFWYLVDEPGESYYPWIHERAGWIHQNPGPGRKLPVFTTKGPEELLANAIDIWCNYNGVDPQLLPTIRKQGKRYWFYNGHRPRYGAVILEAEAVDFRVNAWAKYIHDVELWFLWHGTHWRHNHQGPKGNLHQRVFTEPVTFLGWNMTPANGDGIVFYPGRMPHYPEEDRGLNEILGSIRLKNIRRGQQDYELMWLAEQKVGRQKILEMVKKVVPESFEADLKGPVKWSQRGDDYDRVRNGLIEILKR